MAENKAHDKEDKRHAKQVDVGHTHQRVDRGACIYYNNGFDVVESVKIRQVGVAAVMAVKAILLDDGLDL